MEAQVNFGKATVSTGYDAAATSVVLNSGGGALLPAAPFRFVWWNSTDYPDPSDDPNVEIAYCTAKATDTLTVERAPVGNEGGSAHTHNTGGKTYKILTGLTAGVLSDIQNVYPNGAPFWNVKHKNIVSQNVTTTNGENDLYTVPTGRKAIVLQVVIWNNSGTSPNVIGKAKVSSTYYRGTATTAATSGTVTTIRGINIPLAAGDSFSLNVAAAIAMNIFTKIIEFDAASPIVFARLLGTITNGDNTIYTCPSGKTATPLSTLDISGGQSTALTDLLYANDSGGALTLKLNIVPSGSSVSSSNIVINSQSATNAAVTGLSTPFNLEAGDLVSLNSNSADAHQSIWGIFFESPLPIS